MVAAQSLSRLRKPRYEILYQVQFLNAKDRETTEEEIRIKPSVPRLSWLTEKVRWLLQKKIVKPLLKKKVIEGDFFGFQYDYCF